MKRVTICILYILLEVMICDPCRIFNMGVNGRVDKQQKESYLTLLEFLWKRCWT